MREIHWAVLGTGVIANEMATALEKNGKKLYAVGNRTYEKAVKFGEKYGIKKVFTDFNEMFTDPEVDVIYITTPHNTHIQFMKKAIENGKHILVEKSITLNSEELDEALELAKEKGVIVAEAMTIFHMPVYKELKKILESGKLGKVNLITMNFGSFKEYNMENRFFNRNLAGGAMLDIGVYAIGFACMMMGYAFDDVRSELVMNSAGTDELDAITLRKGKTIAQLTTAIGVNMPTFAAVYGTKGHIDIPEFKNPTRAVLRLDGQEPVELAHPFEINGFEYEIREAQACAEAGRLQSERMTGQQTIAVMRIMDEIRRQNGFRFPFERKE